MSRGGVYTASGVSLSFDAGSASVIEAHMARLGLLAAGHFVDARREMGEYMIGQVQDAFDRQRLFDGAPMPQSKAALKRAGKTLIKAHHLYDSYVSQLEGADSVAAGSNSPYARIHHFGGETGRAGHRFVMTARPVLGMTPKREQRLGDFLIRSIEAAQ